MDHKGKKEVFKVAAVQAAPVFLDQEACTKKACDYIAMAAGEGAELIALPETFIPGGPYWAWHKNMKEGLAFSQKFFENSVEIPSETTKKIGETARKNNVYVVAGISEREGKTLYNTLLYYNNQGEIIGKHRKLKPTGSEKLVWGEGDGSTHRIYETPFGNLGGLICGEHTMALPGYTLAAMGEQIHIASWVGFGTWDISLTEICSKYHAIAYNTFVICTQSVVSEEILETVGIEGVSVGNAWSAIIESGTGKLLGGPLPHDQEGIVTAEIDLKKAIKYYFFHETTGHYWPKQFRVYMDREEYKPLNYLSRAGAPEDLHQHPQNNAEPQGSPQKPHGENE
ncbi:MAG TPA: carbon-nitrogen hydrolase family protein [Firmicutes bacterium]|nr:carbon-nitrogen hydrolase family protein [Bacillota bacterium]